MYEVTWNTTGKILQEVVKSKCSLYIDSFVNILHNHLLYKMLQSCHINGWMFSRHNSLITDQELFMFPVISLCQIS